MMNKLDFGIYVHKQGPVGLLDECAKEITEGVASAFIPLRAGGLDGLFFSVQTLAIMKESIRAKVRKNKKNYRLKLITGGSLDYNWFVEIDINIRDGIAIEAESAGAMKALIIEAIARSLDAWKDLDPLLKNQVCSALQCFRDSVAPTSEVARVLGLI